EIGGRRVSRRRFLQAAVASAALPALGLPWQRGRADHAVAVRRNIYALTPDPAGNDHPIVAAYKAGVAAMRARPTDDPTGWIFQASIHGAMTADPAWNQCQHGSFFFLSWHRMYLYFFERILRDAAGAPEFVLPYWNYSDDPTQAALPEPFRLPADPATNPLFVAQRHPLVNQGVSLPEDITSYADAFALANFSPTATQLVSFGGTVVSGPIMDTGTHSALENQPHDIIHVVVGGHPLLGTAAGLMTDPRTAAQDPIFWLHHGNIDRLWERWLEQAGGRANPADAVWLDTAFPFFDETGKEVVLSGADIVDVVGSLGYTYDDAPPHVSPARPPAPPPGPEIVLASAAAPVLVGAAMPLTVAETAPEASTTVLGEDPLRVALEPSPSAARALEALRAPDAAGRVHLIIEDIKSDQPIGAYYQVYLNLPEGEAPDPKGISYVGNFSFFGRTPATGRCGPSACGQVFDITELVKRQTEQGAWQEEPSLTFVLAGLPLTQGERVRLPESVRPEVGAIRIVRQ
ncbi:MAG TPA: tyrosinase family protein, partial [Geminicoccaceae bacterium]|nr:tyrosinase family protein [Geminicoccaceae bacterium]